MPYDRSNKQEQLGEVLKIVFQDKAQQWTFVRFADMPALQLVEHIATTAAQAVDATGVTSVGLVELGLQGLECIVPRQPLQLSA